VGGRKKLDPGRDYLQPIDRICKRAMGPLRGSKKKSMTQCREMRECENAAFASFGLGQREDVPKGAYEW